MRTFHVAINHAANYLAAINWHRDFSMLTSHGAINHPATYFVAINCTAISHAAIHHISMCQTAINLVAIYDVDIYHVDIYHTAVYHTAIYLARGHLLCVCVLENYVFLDPEIDLSITARDVLNRRVKTAHLFQFPRTPKFFHMSSWSRFLGSKEFNPH
jgi:hypothetical protein